MTQLTRRSFLLNKNVQGFYMLLPFRLAAPPVFHATHIPKGNLVTLNQLDVFPGKVHFSRLAAGYCSFFLLRGPQGGGVDSKVDTLDQAGLRGP